jgi:hypothetical protein
MTYFGSTEWYQRVAEGLVPKYTLVEKWGRNDTVGTTIEPIVSSTLAGVLWRPTTAETVRVKAGGNVNDTAAGTGARTIQVEGLDENYALASESLTLAGASASASTTTTFTRVHRLYVLTTGTYLGSNAGEIILENTAGTSNIITVDNHVASVGQSLHCSYSAPANHTVWLVHLYYNTDTTKTSDVHVVVNDDISVVAAPFGASRLLLEYEGVVRDIQFLPAAPIRMSKAGVSTPLDIGVYGAVSSTTSTVSAQMRLLLKDES